MASKKSKARKSTAPAVAAAAEPGDKLKKPRYRLRNRANPPVEVTAEPLAKGGWLVQGARGKPIRIAEREFLLAFNPC